MNYHIDKRWRYTLGASLETGILNLLEELIMAKNAPQPLKVGYLIKANSYLEVAILKLRLCLELGVDNETRIFQAQKHAAEIGRMLGGWIKSTNAS